MTIQGQIIDIHSRRIFLGAVEVRAGRIHSIEERMTLEPQFIMPGLIDAHVHVESSMLVPSEFARLAVRHGTVATVSDPHEIANVLGLEGVSFMLENARNSPLKFYFGAPSCVPATPFETAGAVLTAEDLEPLLPNPRIHYLAEMMNYPGVLQKDPEVMAKLQLARKLGKPIDGHAPGLRGEKAKHYAEAGISTDHECTTFDEALDKLRAGMHILIREGSAAKNFDALIDLLPQYPDRIMFCSDDKHPDDLMQGHINKIVAKALSLGYDLYDVLRAACLNPVLHYKLDVGLLRPGDPADFIVVQELDSFEVKQNYIEGKLVAQDGQPNISKVRVNSPNRFKAAKTQPEDFQIPLEQKATARVIDVLEGSLLTREGRYECTPKAGLAQINVADDVLKIAVVNRYQAAKPALAFVRNTGLKKGAIASCVAHDSHNIIAVGCTDEALSRVVNAVIRQKGGIAALSEKGIQTLPLEVAGIMSKRDGFEVAKEYERIDHFVKEKLGTTLTAPFMTLSFLALLVIPQLKLSDKGLFDGEKFTFQPLFLD